MGTIGNFLRTGGNSAQEESRPQSSRAEGLIEEFESSEKGWFWETTRDGTLVLHQRQRGPSAGARGRRPDRAPVHGLDLVGDSRRWRNFGKDAWLLPVIARRVPGSHRPGKNQERDLVVDFGPARPRRGRPLLRVPRLRIRPDQDAPIGSRTRSARAPGLADRTSQPRSPSPRARRCAGRARREESTAAPCFCSISTASRRSTTRWATRREIRCCGWCR